MNKKQLIQLAATVFGMILFYFAALPPFAFMSIRAFGNDGAAEKFEGLEMPIEWLCENVPGFCYMYEPYLNFWENVIRR